MSWDGVRFLSCSILPVRRACNLACPFCFSRASISDLERPRARLSDAAVLRFLRWSRDRGATRLVITGGGEPLLRPDEVLRLLRLGRTVFSELTCFTNGARLTPALGRALREAGLSYLCWSRHHHEDEANRALMGADAPDLEAVLAASAGLPLRATCVMARGWIDGPEAADAYLEAMAGHGVPEVTFKHTYRPWSGSLFRGNAVDRWVEAHQIHRRADPLAGRGAVVGRLPWGPLIRRIGRVQAAWYWEPDPAWEQARGIARSTNLLADGGVYASLEDSASLLFSVHEKEPRWEAPVA